MPTELSYQVKHVSLEITVNAQSLSIVCTQSYELDPTHGQAGDDLILLGCEALSLTQIIQDDIILTNSIYTLTRHYNYKVLTINNPPASGTITIHNEVQYLPMAGAIYSDLLNLSFFLSRADNLFTITTIIRANQLKFPTLFTNGEMIEHRILEHEEHMVIWRDQIPKTKNKCLIVLGKLASIEDFYSTQMQGRLVTIKLYLPSKYISMTSIALKAIKHIMDWSEKKLKLEPKADTYTMLAIPNIDASVYNNTSNLSLFEASLIITGYKSATDQNYKNIFRLIAKTYLAQLQTPDNAIELYMDSTFGNADRCIQAIKQNFNYPHVINTENIVTAKWLGMQAIYKRIILELVKKIDLYSSIEMPCHLAPKILQIIDNKALDSSIKAELLTLPNRQYIIASSNSINIDQLCMAYAMLEEFIGKIAEHQWLKIYKSSSINTNDCFDHQQLTKRKLKNLALYYLTATHNPKYITYCVRQFYHSPSITDKYCALIVLCTHNTPKNQSLIKSELKEIMDLYNILTDNNATTGNFSLDILLNINYIFSLNQEETFEIYNAFANSNVFHDPTGVSYNILAKIIIQLDKSDSKLACNLLDNFMYIKNFDQQRQEKIYASIQSICLNLAISTELSNKAMQVSQEYSNVAALPRISIRL